MWLYCFKIINHIGDKTFTPSRPIDFVSITPSFVFFVVWCSRGRCTVWAYFDGTLLVLNAQSTGLWWQALVLVHMLAIPPLCCGQMVSGYQNSDGVFYIKLSCLVSLFFCLATCAAD